MNENETKYTFMNAMVSRELAQTARVAAAVQGMSRSELIRKAVIGYLKQLETKSTVEVQRDPE